MSQGKTIGDSPVRNADVLIVLSTLCAEGTPVMALDLCREWLGMGLSVCVATFFDQPEDMRPEFDGLGIPVFGMHIPRGGMRRYPLLAARTAAICRTVRPRAVLSMPLGWHAFVALGAKGAGVSRVAAHVGNFPPHWLRRGFGKFKTEVWLGRPFTARLICCSEYVREGVVRHFQLPKSATSVVYNGSDLAGIAARAEVARASSGSEGRPLRVGMVARLEQHKDQDTLIEATAILSRTMPVELWLIGDGSRRRALEALVASKGLESAVRFLGVRRDVPELLGALDVFAFSAKPDEGLGIALVEAMAAHVPVVATDVGACKEVLEGGRLGRLVPYGDADAMARALGETAAGGTDVVARVESAARSAEARFSKQAMAAGYAQELGLVPRRR